MAAYARTLPSGSREADIAGRYLDHQLGQIRMARELGVTIAVGIDAGSPGVHHGESVREEIRLLMTAGLSHEEILQCATLKGATLLGIGGKLGRLSPGMAGTFLLVRGRPEEVVTASTLPDRVYIRGKLCKNTPHTL